jgi:hypothetical protein
MFKLIKCDNGFKIESDYMITDVFNPTEPVLVDKSGAVEDKRSVFTLTFLLNENKKPK